MKNLTVTFDNLDGKAPLAQRESKKGNTFYTIAQEDERHTNTGVRRISWSDSLPTEAQVGNVKVPLDQGLTGSGHAKREGRRPITIDGKAYQAVVRVSRVKAENTWLVFVSVHPSGGAQPKVATKSIV